MTTVDRFRGRNVSDSVIFQFRVDGFGLCRIVRRGELSDKNPSESAFERYDEEKDVWVDIGTLAPIQAHPAVEGLMDL